MYWVKLRNLNLSNKRKRYRLEYYIYELDKSEYKLYKNYFCFSEQFKKNPASGMLMFDCGNNQTVVA